MKKDRFIQLQPEDIDVAAIMEAAREGRLFIKEKTIPQEMVREKCVRTILKYVSRIEAYVSDEYRGRVRMIWESILSEDENIDLFIMQRGAHRGEPNYYRVTLLVIMMYEMGVYVRTQKPLYLHYKLEGTQKKNAYYKAATNYCFASKDRKRLIKLIQNR